MTRLRCGDKVHQLSVRAKSGAREVTVDGAAFRIAVEPLGPTSFVLSQAGRRETFHCVRAGDTIHLFWRGAVYQLVQERERARTLQRSLTGALETPMPGRVIAIKAAPGQQVAKGDEILVVEAMKMENAIRAPRAGRLKSVAVKLGDMVTPGSVLAELE